MNLKERKPQLIDVSKLILNDKNPRLIKDDNFKKLMQSLREFPKMLEYRPIIVTEDMMVLGGNMRLKAALELGFTKVPILVASGLTDEEQRELIIKDNIGYGEWDWDMLANEWDTESLNEWGLFVPNLEEIDLDKFFQNDESDKEAIGKIILEYPSDECDKIKNELLKHGKTPEAAIYNLLGL